MNKPHNRCLLRCFAMFVLIMTLMIISGCESEEDTLINIKVTDAENTQPTTNITVFRDKDPYGDTYRPQAHFTTLRKFINDPNGLIYNPGSKTWHLYYQYNPTGKVIGNQVWGHAESADLVHWQEMPIAIPQGDGLGAIFSGSAVIDENNTSGLFTDNTPDQSKLVALFTHDGGDITHGVEKQSLAYSKDHGRTWILYPGNPVISNAGHIYDHDFRDPKVFRHDDKWLMVIAGGKARIFSSDDLINWTHESDIRHKNKMPVYSECPDLYPLEAPDGTVKWLYNASGVWYLLGRLEKVNDKYTYIAETDKIPFNAATGYATQTYYNDGAGKNRILSVSWLVDMHGDNIPDKEWMGTQSFPHEIKLKEINGELRITSYPAEEINVLRNGKPPMLNVANKAVSPDTPNILANMSGKFYDIEATIEVGTAEEVGFRLLTGNGNSIQVIYNDKENLFISDRNGFSYNNWHGNGARISTKMYKTENGTVTFRIIMDVSVIETFGNGGEAAMNYIFFGNPENTGLEFYAAGGTATVVDLKMYELKSIHH